MSKRARGGWIAAALLGGALGGCGGVEDGGACETAWFATEVIASSWGTGQSFGRDLMPDVVLGPPQGAGCCQGSTDVVSLGNGGSVVLGFGEVAIADGPGPDFVVFENPFETGEDVFAELAKVEVSDDGAVWHGYPCEPGGPEARCAGQAPVYRIGGDGPVDPARDGGDAFDLAELGLARARYVRIVDRVDLTGPAGVFDLDAVGLVHATCAP